MGKGSNAAERVTNRRSDPTQPRLFQTSNSTIMVKDNFFGQPVGRAVLYLNDFHNGKNLAVLNQAARLVPDDVKGFASLLSNVVNPDPDQVQDIVNLLHDYANDAVDGRLKTPKQ